MTKELLFSVTAKDFDFKFTIGTGNGGQKKQKTSSACHCKHVESGARGYAEDTRSQLQNKQMAWKRCIETKEFKNWYKLQVAKATGQQAILEDTVEKMMNDRYIRTEIKNEKGLWQEVPKDAKLEE